jgi:hypothetical protein
MGRGTHVFRVDKEVEAVFVGALVVLGFLRVREEQEIPSVRTFRPKEVKE